MHRRFGGGCGNAGTWIGQCLFTSIVFLIVELGCGLRAYLERKGHIIYRLIPTAAHTDDDIEETLIAFSETKAKLDAGDYKIDTVPDMAEYSAKRFDYMTSKLKNK